MTVQIRFTANKAMTNALKQLKTKYRFMSDTEIFKLAFSRFYHEEMDLDENGFTAKDRAELREALADLEEGKNIEGPYENAQEFLDSLKNDN